jgi:hypothetical protein
VRARNSGGIPNGIADALTDVRGVIVMAGFITTRHLVTHSAVIVREFGPRCFARCLWRALTAHQTVTFLECVSTR